MSWGGRGKSGTRQTTSERYVRKRMRLHFTTGKALSLIANMLIVIADDQVVTESAIH